MFCRVNISSKSKAPTPMTPQNLLPSMPNSLPTKVKKSKNPQRSSSMPIPIRLKPKSPKSQPTSTDGLQSLPYNQVQHTALK